MRLNHTSLLLALCICLLSGYMVSCWSTPTGLTNPGVSSKDLAKAAETQEKATEVIDTEATSIEIKTKELDSKKSAGKIKNANKDLKENINVLKDEAAAKDEYVEKYKALTEDYDKLKEKYDSSFRTITYWLYGVGALLTAAGLFLAIKTAGEFWYAPLVGVSLIVTAVGAVWIEDNIGKILGGITIILGLIGVRMWIIQNKTSKSAVKVAEQLKEHIPQTVKEQMFGTYHSTGTVEVEMDTVTKKHVASLRKAIHKEWAPAAKIS